MPATHARTQIRNALKVLLTGLTTTGADVYTGRTNPLDLDEGELPCLLIGADPNEPADEQVQARSFGSQVTAANRSTQRTYRFPVRGLVKQAADIEDKLDTIAMEVEQKLYTDPLLGGLASEMRLMSTSIHLAGEGDKPVGEVLMMFEVDYWCIEGAPQTITN